MRQFYPEEGTDSNNPENSFDANSLPRSIRAHADLIQVFKVKRGRFKPNDFGQFGWQNLMVKI